jgi:hypothetical protein
MSIPENTFKSALLCRNLQDRYGLEELWAMAYALGWNPKNEVKLSYLQRMKLDANWVNFLRVSNDQEKLKMKDHLCGVIRLLVGQRIKEMKAAGVNLNDVVLRYLCNVHPRTSLEEADVQESARRRGSDVPTMCSKFGPAGGRRRRVAKRKAPAKRRVAKRTAKRRVAKRRVVKRK